MANPHKGEVSFSVDGKTYTLRFSANAMCEMEDALNKGILEIAQEMMAWQKAPERIRMAFIRCVFWAGLRDHHPEIDVRAAGELLVAAGGLLKGSQLITEAFTRAFPAAETKGARPPKGKAALPNTTGQAS